MGALTLYNTLHNEKQAFEPVDASHVKMYACGPTVYSYAHIGNARMAVVCDLLARVLKAIYPKVTYVSNITDIDDKIITAAKETGEPIEVITRKYESIYNEDMAILGVSKPDIQPRATEHIPDMIRQVEQLIERGAAYAQDGHVCYHVPSNDRYGVLSGRSRDEQIAGARVEIAPYKKDPADFVLWKPSTDDQPGWDSPWGFGRPGWHIECSAMSEATLGLPFDIHGGGADLKFPHHENEIAQCCSAHGLSDPQGYVRYWVHNGFVTVEGEKMSKSLGNIQLVHDLVQHYPGEVLRLALLSAHYRQPLNWTRSTIDQAQKTLDRMYRVLKDLSTVEASASDISASVMDALRDDLNTPKALAALTALAGDSALDDAARKGALLGAGQLLGVLQKDPDEWLGYAQNGGDDATQIEALIAKRAQARADKDFAAADNARDALSAMGVEIEDTPNGTVWKKI